MIEINDAEKTFYTNWCSLCHSKENVKSIRFSDKFSNGSTVICLCDKCMEELKNKIEKLGGK